MRSINLGLLIGKSGSPDSDQHDNCEVKKIIYSNVVPEKLESLEEYKLTVEQSNDIDRKNKIDSDKFRINHNTYLISPINVIKRVR